MEQVLGTADSNPFTRLAREDDRRFEEMIARLTARL
jgi:hypothetical protein